MRRRYPDDSVVLSVAEYADRSMREIGKLTIEVDALRGELVKVRARTTPGREWLGNRSFAHALDVVSARYGLTEGVLLGATRSKTVVRARKILYFLGVRVLSFSLTEVGARLGRDHTTILSGVQSLEAEMVNDERLRSEVVEASEGLRIRLEL